MKKFLLFALVVALMFGSGVCGYFIRGASREDKTMSIATAQNVVKKIAKAGNFVEEDNSVIKTSVKTMSNYTDYEESTVNYNGKEDFVKAFIAMLYFATDGNVRANTYYTSTATYKIGNTDVIGEMNFYIKLTETSATFYLKDVKNNINMVMVVSSSDNTINHYQINGYMASTFMATDGLTYFEICSNNEKITQFAYSEIEWNGAINNLADAKASDVKKLTVYDCNITTGRVMNKSTANGNGLTDAEKLDLISRTVNEFNSIEFADVICKKFTKSDFLKRAYENLGYNVVEN